MLYVVSSLYCHLQVLVLVLVRVLVLVLDRIHPPGWFPSFWFHFSLISELVTGVGANASSPKRSVCSLEPVLFIFFFSFLFVYVLYFFVVLSLSRHCLVLFLTLYFISHPLPFLFFHIFFVQMAAASAFDGGMQMNHNVAVSGGHMAVVPVIVGAGQPYAAPIVLRLFLCFFVSSAFLLCCFFCWDWIDVSIQLVIKIKQFDR